MGYRTLRASRGIYVLILEAKLGSGPNMGPQTDPKRAPTECHSFSARELGATPSAKAAMTLVPIRKSVSVSSSYAESRELALQRIAKLVSSKRHSMRFFYLGVEHQADPPRQIESSVVRSTHQSCLGITIRITSLRTLSTF
jgi:hypothetical protein